MENDKKWKNQKLDQNVVVCTGLKIVVMNGSAQTVINLKIQQKILGRRLFKMINKIKQMLCKIEVFIDLWDHVPTLNKWEKEQQKTNKVLSYNRRV